MELTAVHVSACHRGNKGSAVFGCCGYAFLAIPCREGVNEIDVVTLGKIFEKLGFVLTEVKCIPAYVRNFKSLADNLFDRANLTLYKT